MAAKKETSRTIMRFAAKPMDTQLYMVINDRGEVALMTASRTVMHLDHAVRDPALFTFAVEEVIHDTGAEGREERVLKVLNEMCPYGAIWTRVEVPR